MRGWVRGVSGGGGGKGGLVGEGGLIGFLRGIIKGG